MYIITSGPFLERPRFPETIICTVFFMQQWQQVNYSESVHVRLLAQDMSCTFIHVCTRVIR